MTFNPESSHGNGYPLGLAGATAATRYVGATASGAPATGTFAVGDFVIDQTGKVYVCTVAGSPGTWLQTGGGFFSPSVAIGDSVVYPTVTSAAAVPGASGRCFFTRVYVPAAYTFDRIQCNLGVVAGTTGTARLGIYNDADGRPTSLIVDGSTVGITVGTGTKEVTINQALAAGTYWLACQPEYTGTAPQFTSTGNGTPFMGGTGSVPMNYVGGYWVANTGALPNPPSSFTVGGNIMLASLRRSA